MFTKSGLATKILKIEWAGDVDPLQTSNFESLARKYRFQALGKACRDLNIRKLCLAHHQDDQAETVLMRLAGGHRGIGLGGISTVAQIPECYGIHGVYQSGLLKSAQGPEDQRPYQPRTLYMSRELKGTKECDYQHQENGNSLHGSSEVRQLQLQRVLTDSKLLPSVQCEMGGVRIHRPLLPFKKERLVATCLEDDMPWFEDSTNCDPTLTTRNAIRHIFKHHRLPRALQPEALVRLSKSISLETQFARETALRLLRSRGTVQIFEPRAGTLSICFPKFPVRLPVEPDGKRDVAMQMNIARMMLQAAMECVTPKERVDLSGLTTAYQTIFPDYHSPMSSAKKFRNSFTVGGVMFQRLGMVVRSPSSPAFNSESSSYYAEGLGEPSLSQQWLLSRQPYASDMLTHPHLDIPPLDARTQSAGWNFYDGRYWIRVSNLTSKMLIVRPLYTGDLKPFKAELDPSTQKRLFLHLKSESPGEIRYTLPVITMVIAKGKERVLSLPTLDISIPGLQKLLDFEVRYKEVPLYCDRAGNEGV